MQKYFCRSCRFLKYIKQFTAIIGAIDFDNVLNQTTFVFQPLLLNRLQSTQFSGKSSSLSECVFVCEASFVNDGPRGPEIKQIGQVVLDSILRSRVLGVRHEACELQLSSAAVPLHMRSFI